MEFTEILAAIRQLYGGPNIRIELVTQIDGVNPLNEIGGCIQRRFLTRAEGLSFYSDAEVLYEFKSIRELEFHVRGIGLAPFTNK